MESGTEDSCSISVRSRTASINSQAYAIPETNVDASHLDDSSSEDPEDDGTSEDAFLDQLVPETSNAFLIGQPDTPMFDSSKYIFQSLVQSLNSVDFSEAIALQTRTSGLINSKSREIKKLVTDVQERLKYLETRFERGAKTSSRIKHNLKQFTHQVEQINAAFETDYPIEFNQAKEKVYERNFDD
ncbi:LAFE_0C04962g1_1 [Lachancea fermentati]|uniref:Biogenesis of lysosome-related organelles complex 1 subunit KXD1 n=1 Tax=Lachancea fermentati TaxID=4955 RepID=A0A1G4M9C8_LACFM|nr:LAFE_0C04962g1_1 [Lachancea fermentati]